MKNSGKFKVGDIVMGIHPNSGWVVGQGGRISKVVECTGHSPFSYEFTYEFMVLNGELAGIAGYICPDEADLIKVGVKHYLSLCEKP